MYWIFKYCSIFTPLLHCSNWKQKLIAFPIFICYSRSGPEWNHEYMCSYLTINIWFLFFWILANGSKHCTYVKETIPKRGKLYPIFMLRIATSALALTVALTSLNFLWIVCWSRYINQHFLYLTLYLIYYAMHGSSYLSKLCISVCPCLQLL